MNDIDAIKNRHDEVEAHKDCYRIGLAHKDRGTLLKMVAALEDGLRSIPVTPHFNSFGERTHNTMREDRVLALLGKEIGDG